MQVSQSLINSLKSQVALLYQAHSQMLGVSLWAKTNGWKGTHEWLGDFSMDLRKDVKGTQKLLADYCGVAIEMPAVTECACKAANLPDCYRQAMKCVMDAQMGWKEIAAESEGLSETDIDAFADEMLTDGIGMIKKLTRWTNYFDQVGDDRAAWVMFDQKRRR
jgi:ferritin